MRFFGNFECMCRWYRVSYFWCISKSIISVCVHVWGACCLSLAEWLSTSNYSAAAIWGELITAAQVESSRLIKSRWWGEANWRSLNCKFWDERMIVFFFTPLLFSQSLLWCVPHLRGGFKQRTSLSGFWKAFCKPMLYIGVFFCFLCSRFLFSW